MASFAPFTPAEGPLWLPRFASSVADLFRRIMPQPLRLKDYATADLPAAADFAQGLVYDSTTLTIKWSDGTSWTGMAATAHAHAIADVTGLQAALDGKLDDGQASAFGLSLLDDADAAAGRSTLGLGTMATQNANSVSITGGAFGNVSITGANTSMTQGTIDLAGVDIKDVTTDRTGNFTLNTGHPSTHQRVISGARTVTIPANATAAIPVGSWIAIVNDTTASVQTLARAPGVALTYLGADADRTIAAGGWARLVKVGTDAWYVYGDGIT